MMTVNPKDAEKARNLFALAITFRKGAEVVLASNDKYAGVAAALCHQSAERMMIAYIHLKDNTVSLSAELTTAEIWNACTMLDEELMNVDDEVQTLLDCEWASCPPAFGQAEPDSEYARQALHYAEKLELAILNAAPGLVVRE